MGSRCKSEAAPATVTGEPARQKATEELVLGKAARPAVTREPGDLPATVDSFARAGCTGRTGTKSPRERHQRVVCAYGRRPYDRVSNAMKKFKFLLFAGAALAAGPAWAQDAPSDDDAIVVVANGVEQPVDQVGQAVTVLDEKTIRTRQEVNVADLLATTPGVRFNRNGTTGSVTGVSLRGAEVTQTLVLIDGVKVNDPSAIGDIHFLAGPDRLLV